MKEHLGQGGSLVILAVLVGGIVQLLKTDRLNLFLAMLSLPAVPKRALPWVAILLGFALAMLEALLRSEPMSAAIAQGLYGVFAGATAVGGDQTVGKMVEARASKSPPPPPSST